MVANEYLKYERWLEKPFCTVDYISRILAESDPDDTEDYRRIPTISENTLHIQNAINDGLLAVHHYEKDIDGFFNDYPILLTLDVVQWVIADDRLTIPEKVRKWESKRQVTFEAYLNNTSWRISDICYLMIGLNPSQPHTNEQNFNALQFSFLMDGVKYEEAEKPPHQKKSKNIECPSPIVGTADEYKTIDVIAWAIRNGIYTPKYLYDWFRKQNGIPAVNDRPKQLTKETPPEVPNAHKKEKSYPEKRRNALYELSEELKASGIDINSMTQAKVWELLMNKPHGLFKDVKDASGKRKFFSANKDIFDTIHKPPLGRRKSRN